VFKVQKANIAGVTLVELIMVMLIVAIMSVAGGSLMAYFVQNSMFIPNQLNMEMLASDALDIMIEGDQQAKGLRFSKEIVTARKNRVTFINQNGAEITYRLRTGQNRFTRSINGGSQETFPYYAPSSGISLAGRNNRVFRYYDISGSRTNNPVNIRKVRLDVIANTGTGSYATWDGQSEQRTAVALKKMQ